MEENQLSAAISDDGNINWDCPCLKDALEPPCGEVFKIAFECYFKSKNQPKGSECINVFDTMQKCYVENRGIYLERFKNDKSDSNLNKE